MINTSQLLHNSWIFSLKCTGKHCCKERSLRVLHALKTRQQWFFPSSFCILCCLSNRQPWKTDIVSSLGTRSQDKHKYLCQFLDHLTKVLLQNTSLGPETQDGKQFLTIYFSQSYPGIRAKLRSLEKGPLILSLLIPSLCVVWDLCFGVPFPKIRSGTWQGTLSRSSEGF